MENYFVQRNKLTGPYAIVLTPFNADGKIDEVKLRSEIEFLACSDVDGVAIGASGSESETMSFDENIHVLRIACDVVSGRKNMILGIAADSIRNSYNMTEQAAKHGVSAVFSCPPKFYIYKSSEIEQYYQILAENPGELPVLLNNTPSSATSLSINTIIKLSEEPNIIGVIDHSSDMGQIMQIIQTTQQIRPDFAVFTGRDDILFPCLTCGCTGSVTPLASIIPEVITGIYSEVKKGCYKEALNLQNSILPVIRLIDTLTFPEGHKLALEIRGQDMGERKIPIIRSHGMNIELLIRQELSGLLDKNM
ncbi:MAG: dihydrodipicolinate synthase family protein [Saccharofermentanales bacterium]